ncbi:MAG: hypothetical protein QOD06_300 [Candidatus Binatota bacterium]|jgi:hypothetical protein|nr:hypothetical protein [Candidatus Binatota bacterium]
MIPSIDLILGTLERALTVAILPAAGNAAAKEEASLGILFTRWLRDVVDHVADAERASYHDCRRALSDVVAIFSTGVRGPAVSALTSEARTLLARLEAETASQAREETRHAKELLVRSLRATREDGDHSAPVIRQRLADLAGRELEREIAFGRATGIDPDGAKGRPLAEVLNAQSALRRAT